MKGILFATALAVMTFAGCQTTKSDDVCGAEPCEQLGYGIQSDWALCAEVVWGVCGQNERCNSSVGHDEALLCANGGMQLCAKYDVHPVPSKIYECVEALKTESCDDVSEGVPPAVCVEALGLGGQQ